MRLPTKKKYKLGGKFVLFKKNHKYLTKFLLIVGKKNNTLLKLKTQNSWIPIPFLKKKKIVTQNNNNSIKEK